MAIDLSIDKTDDPRFIAAAGTMINNAVNRVQPAEVHLIKIKNWFDHKWFRFNSGPTRLVTPPFAPNRALGQRRWVNRAPFGYIESSEKLTIHGRQRIPGSEIFSRKLTELSNSAAFAWYGSNSDTNLVGSIMVYTIDGGIETAWYCSLRRHGDQWRLDRVKGINRGEMLSYLVPVVPPTVGLADFGRRL